MQAIIPDELLANLAAEASTLVERLAGEWYEPCPTLEDPDGSAQIAEDRLQRWCQVVAQGNGAVFQNRLAWDGYDLATVKSRLGSVRLKPGQALPGWTQTLRAMMQAARESVESGDRTVVVPGPLDNLPSPLDPDNPLPFEAVFAPALAVARQTLGAKLVADGLFPAQLWAHLDPSAYLSLERSLCRKLVNIGGRTLEAEFNRVRKLGPTYLALLIGQSSPKPGQEQYLAFTRSLLADGLLSFFQTYPVLGRLVATTIDFWVEATAEFLCRLVADASAIAPTFAPDHGEVSQRVVHLDAGQLSDPHEQGRSVIALTFDSGLKLIYKPKGLALEVAYGELLDWCNRHGCPLPFKVLAILNRDAYGWVEYVEHLPCADAEAAARFYRRSGLLLGLLYTLRATDCHHENLIAHGEHLVLVDMETLMHHEAAALSAELAVGSTATSINRSFVDSVMATGLLPSWDFNRDNRVAFDISGLGSIDPQPVPWRIPSWQAVNTDEMRQSYEISTIPLQKNIPRLEGCPLNPNDYLAEIESGFRQMYEFLRDHRLELLSAGSPLVKMQGRRVRFVFRATKIYGIFAQNTLSPDALRCGVARSIELDILSRAFLNASQCPSAWPILQSELQAMECLDIPYFAASSDRTSLDVGVERPIPDYFTAASYNQAIARLQSLDAADLALQLSLIRGTLYARAARLPAVESAALSAAVATPLLADSDAAGDRLLNQAQAIAAELDRIALRGGDGSINWIGLGQASHAQRFQLEPLGESLYDGNGGVVLFLAALDRATGQTVYRDLCLSVLQPLRQFLHTASPEALALWQRQIGIGGARGIGSILYALANLSHWLGDRDLFADAIQLAHWLEPTQIAADQAFSVMEGSAGALLGLLALVQRSDDTALRDRAIACGQHLLRHQACIDGKPKAWKTLGPTPLAGFAHGAAGIAYALLRLYAVTEDRAYLEGAEEAIAYERNVFSPEAANWPDFSAFDGKPTFPVRWCHGAAGVGLGRLAGLSILDTEEIRAEIALALQTTLNLGLQDRDHLCCGNFGRFELLLVAAQVLNRPELATLARQQAADLNALAAQTGRYRIFSKLPTAMYSPTFFWGTAGIGYQLLRLADPDGVPSVLVWQ